jgi:hypothetical protein
MTAARWRDVGEDLAALGHQLADSLGLARTSAASRTT